MGVNPRVLGFERFTPALTGRVRLFENGADDKSSAWIVPKSDLALQVLFLHFFGVVVVGDVAVAGGFVFCGTH